jgi:hypothetical protein
MRLPELDSLAVTKTAPAHRLSEEEALRASGADATDYATILRDASNAKARRELEFRRRLPEWI